MNHTRFAQYPLAGIPGHTLIRELPASDRPDARLTHHGVTALSGPELLACLLRLPSLEQAEALLAAYDGLPGLAKAPETELAAFKGLGPAKVTQLKAAFELGLRLVATTPIERPRIKSPADAASLLLGRMSRLEQEHLCTILLDTRNQVLRIETVYIGSLNTAVVRVAELFREAIRVNSAALVIAHNHPSGELSPSPEDVHLTRQVVEAGKLLNIEVLDHLIIGHQRWVSLKERGLGF